MDEHFYAGFEVTMTKWRLVTGTLFILDIFCTSNGRDFALSFYRAPLPVQIAVGFIVALAVLEIPRVCWILVGFMSYEISEHTAKVFKRLTGKTTKVRADG